MYVPLYKNTNASSVVGNPSFELCQKEKKSFLME
jgi:hypothetical protein